MSATPKVPKGPGQEVPAADPVTTPTPMASRRHLLLAGGGGAAAIAGASLAWWRLRPAPVQDDHGLWQMSFPAPDGSMLNVADMRGRPLLVNFWATWCPPCVAEMPDLDQFYQSHRDAGWQVLGLAIDAPTPVRQFLQRIPVSFPIGLAGLQGTELGKALGNRTGALPFTVVFNRRGEIVRRKLGQTHLDELNGWAAAIDA